MKRSLSAPAICANGFCHLEVMENEARSDFCHGEGAMFPNRTILHPTDFSERSAHAFQLATSLARDHGARLIVLHVISPTAVSYSEFGAVVIPPDQEERAALQEQLRQYQAGASGIEVECRLVEGNAADEVLRVAEETHADLIVMGTHGRSGLSRVVMGSVAEQVVRRAACPVLTVKAPFNPEESPAVILEATQVVS